MKEKKYSNTVILTGPCRSGKTTLAAILSQKLSRPHISLDALGYDFMKVIYRNGDQELYIKYLQKQQYDKWFAHTRRYELHVAERVLAEYSDCIIDFGAGHSVYDKKEDRTRMENLLRPYDFVFLLFPSENKDESLDILMKRYEEPLHTGTARHLVYHESYFALSKYQIFTAGKSPEESSDEILAILKLHES